MDRVSFVAELVKYTDEEKHQVRARDYLNWRQDKLSKVNVFARMLFICGCFDFT